MASARRVAVINDAGSVPLPSFKFAGMPIGLVISDTTGQNWQLSVSNAAIDHTTVEAVGSNPQLRWLQYTGGGNPLPGAFIPINADTNFVDIVVNGETCGGLRIFGNVQTQVISGGAGSAAFLGLFPNGAQPATGRSTQQFVSYAASGGALAFNAIPAAAARLIQFDILIPYTKTGRGSRFMWGSDHDSNNTGETWADEWQDSTTAITSMRVTLAYKTGGTACAIGTGNFISDLTASGYPGSKSWVGWQALGNP